MTFKAYRKYAEKESQKVASIDNLEKEKMVTTTPFSFGKPSPTLHPSMELISQVHSWTKTQDLGI